MEARSPRSRGDRLLECRSRAITNSFPSSTRRHAHCNHATIRSFRRLMNIPDRRSARFIGTLPAQTSSPTIRPCGSAAIGSRGRSRFSSESPTSDRRASWGPHDAAAAVPCRTLFLNADCGSSIERPIRYFAIAAAQGASRRLAIVLWRKVGCTEGNVRRHWIA